MMNLGRHALFLASVLTAGLVAATTGAPANAGDSGRDVNPPGYRNGHITAKHLAELKRAANDIPPPGEPGTGADGWYLPDNTPNGAPESPDGQRVEVTPDAGSVPECEGHFTDIYKVHSILNWGGYTQCLDAA